MVGRWFEVDLKIKRFLAFLLNLSGFLPAAGGKNSNYIRLETQGKRVF